ncbi:hypothetical protein HMPREF9141_2030 [Prevotella multiformis DSM 16608]|uniref:Uncharacterized protein n=1 Tax=Prevotella multiformis DSM 16608 TaxID=888743 RepID=F0F8W3_9BACT|nr:hypothetical protein HMPREF9141_2030 [Prevotella multiformis DSM 16608]
MTDPSGQDGRRSTYPIPFPHLQTDADREQNGTAGQCPCPVPAVMPDEWKETEKRWLPLAEAIAFLFQISSKRTAPERRYKMPGRSKMSFRT